MYKTKLNTNSSDDIKIRNIARWMLNNETETQLKINHLIYKK